MPSAFRDPKSLPNWFELHYFRWPSRMPRLRSLLIWGTFGGTLLIVAAIFAIPGTSPAFQAGPVCEAHSMFNNDCSRCHDQAFQTPQRFLPWNSQVRAVSDQACQQCHAGPKHNTLQLNDPSCASCHREHRGRMSLKHMDDSHCSNCHTDIAANRKNEGQPNYQNVSAFPSGHPEFTLFRKNEVDPGKLHFNHQAHLKADGVLVSSTGARRVLNCASCHELDSAGRYLQPVTFEKHCAECHPLSVQLLGVKDDPKIRAAVQAFNKIPAPHKEPSVVRAVLRDRLLGFVQAHPVAIDEKERDVPKSRPLEASATVSEWVWSQKQLTQAEQILFVNKQLQGNEQAIKNAGGCRFCHIEKKPASTGTDGLLALPEYEPTRVPQRWMPHARFSHRGHQMLKCGECHQAATSSKTADVLMPKVENCGQCHNARVGLRHDCVDCHNYHDRTPTGEPFKGMTIDQCLGK